MLQEFEHKTSRKGGGPWTCQDLRLIRKFNDIENFKYKRLNLHKFHRTPQDHNLDYFS